MGGSSKKQTVGYKYYMALHFAIAYGPIDKLLRVLVGDREAWSGEEDANAQIDIDKPNLFGGDKREGGVDGTGEIMMGGSSQALPSLVSSLLPSPSPSFRGLFSFFYDGLISANNPYVKPWAFQVQRITAGWHGGTAWYAAKAPVQIDAGFALAEDATGWEYKEIADHANPGTTNLTPPSSGWSTGQAPFSGGAVSGGNTTWTIHTILWTRRTVEIPSGIQCTLRVTAENGCVVLVDGVDVGAVNRENIQIDNNQNNVFTFVIPGGTHTLAIKGFDETNPGGGTYLGVQITIDGVLGMNPAHIIYQCITDPQWGMGYPTASIDVDSFEAAADTLYAEGFGLCMLWNQQDELGAFIRVVLDHCGALLYTDPKTGKFSLKLLRGDYDVGDLETFDPSNIGSLDSFQRVGYGDTTNEITVVYRDVRTNKDVPITVHNLANIQAQGGVVSKTIQYPGLPSGSLAARVAQRDLLALSTPLAKARMTVNRSAWNLAPGSVFKLTWPKLGLTTIVMRVLAIDYGTLADGTISVEIAEDVFGLPAASYASQQSTGWVIPDTTPSIIALQDVVEAPYRSLVSELGAADLSILDEDAAYFAAHAAAPNTTSTGFDLYSRVGAAAYEQNGSGSFVASGTISTSLVRESASIIVLDTQADLDQVDVDSLAVIGTGRMAEWIAVKTINVGTMTLTVARGMLDTTPQEHAAGTRIFFDDARAGFDVTERATGETVDFKLSTLSTGGELDYTSATTMTITAQQRQARPYAPGNVLIDGQAYPTTLSLPFAVTWSHRDRLQQTAYYVEQDEGSIGPEAGTTYSAYAYDDDTDALLQSLTGISGTTWSPSITGDYRLRLEIEAVRGGIEGWQRQVRVFDFTNFGPGDFSYYKSHTIAGTASGAQTDYQMRVVANFGSGTDSGQNVYLNSHTQADFDDVRFTAADGTTLLNYWKDQSTLVSGVSCVFWVEVPSIPVSPGTVDIRMYYGNAAATDASDIQATMLGGDDFRTMRKTWQVDGGAGPRWGTGITKTTSGDVYMAVWDSDTTQHWLYKTTDGGVTAPTLVSSPWAASSGRTHSNLTTNGSSKIFMLSHTTTATYLKISTDSGATWGSEITVFSGASNVVDPVPVYVSASLLWVFVRVINGANFEIRCYESTNDGASFALKNTPYTLATAGTNSLEDLDAIRLSSGRVMLAWERETTEKGEARCDFVYSDNNCSTYSSAATIVNSTGTIDDEGGSFAITPGGDLDYFFGSTRGGGSSYLNQQVWRTRYDETAGTWSTPELFNESYGGVENNAVYVDAGNLLLLSTRHYDATNGVDSTYMLTMTRVGGDDLSDRGWTQDLGIAYVLDGGMWVEGWQVTTVTRAFLPYGGYTGADSVIEALVSAPDPLTDVDCRIVFRYGSATNHYMLSMLKSTTNQLQWYKMVSGNYTLLHQAAITPALNTLYRIIVTLRGTNPTTLTATVNGTTILNAVTEATSTQTTGKIGLAAGNQITRRAHMARHIFARKYVAVEPTHGAWGAET